MDRNNSEDSMALVKKFFKGGLCVSAFILPIYVVLAIFKK